MDLFTMKTNEELNELRDKLCTNQFKKGYNLFENCTMPEIYGIFKEQIDNFKVYEDDIWVSCFPKSGSTWIREMVWIVKNDLHKARAAEPIPFRFPVLEHCTNLDFREYQSKVPIFDPFLPVTESIKFCENLPRPRFIATFLPWELLPLEIRTLRKRPKIIHIVRNVKDTCVSYFHHCKLTDGYTGSFEDFWQLFVSGKVKYTPYWSNVMSYWNKRDQILCITYEDMIKNLKGVTTLVANYLGRDLCENDMDDVVQFLSYENMKKRKEEQLEPVAKFLKSINLCESESGQFRRAGLIGNYRAQMCADVIDIFDIWEKENTSGTEFSSYANKYFDKK